MIARPSVFVVVSLDDVFFSSSSSSSFAFVKNNTEYKGIDVWVEEGNGKLKKTCVV